MSVVVSESKPDFKARLLALLAELEEFGIPNTQLSVDMGKSKAYLANLLSGNNQTPGQFFYDYFQARFNVNPAWLRAGDGDMFLPGGKHNHEDQTSFVTMFYSLPEKEQAALVSMIRILYDLHHA